MNRFVFYMAFQQLRREWKKNISMFIVMFLGTFLIAYVLFFYHAYHEMKIQDAEQNAGSYMVNFREFSQKQLREILESNMVQKYGIQSSKSNVNLSSEEFQTDASTGKKEKYSWYCMDAAAMEMKGFQLLYGRLPENSREVLVSASLKENGKYVYQMLSSGGGSDTIEVIRKDRSSDVYQIVGVVNDMKAGMESASCDIIGLQENIKLPGCIYVKTKTTGRRALKEWICQLGYAYSEQVYDTVYMEKRGLVYTGNYDVELNNTLLDAWNEDYAAQGAQNAKKLAGILPVMVACAAALMLISAVFIQLEMQKKENGILRLCGFDPVLLIKYYIFKMFLVFLPASMLAAVVTKAGCHTVVELVQRVRQIALAGFSVSWKKTDMCAAFLIMFAASMVSVLLPVVLFFRETIMEQLREDVSKNGRKREKRILVKGCYGWKLTWNLFFTHKLRNFTVLLSISLVSIVFLTSLICFQVTKQKLNDQSQSYRSEFTLFGAADAKVYSLLQKIPYVSWSDVLYDGVAVCDGNGWKIAGGVKKTEYQYWYADSKMSWEICGGSEWFYEHYLRGEGSALPSYQELEKQEAGVLCDQGCVRRNGTLVKEQMFAEKTPEKISWKTGKYLLVAARGEIVDQEKNEGVTMPIFFLPKSVYAKYASPSYTVAYLNAESGKEQQMREWFKAHEEELDMTVGDYAEEYLEARDTSQMLCAVLLFSFVLLTGISLLHIGNSFQANIYAQRREYAVLRALGMSRLEMGSGIVGMCLNCVVVNTAVMYAYITCFLPKILRICVGIQLTGYGYCYAVDALENIVIFVILCLIGMVYFWRQQRRNVLEGLL